MVGQSKEINSRHKAAMATVNMQPIIYDSANTSN